MKKNKFSNQQPKIVCFTGDGAINVNLFRLLKSMRQFEKSIEVMDWDRKKRFNRKEVINDISYSFVMRGWGYKNNWLILGNIIWMIKVLYYSYSKKPDFFWTSNFQNALPVAIISCFKKTPFVYYIHDHISISYQWPKTLVNVLQKIDNWIIKRAHTVIVPDEKGILPHAKHLAHKFQILPNVPFKNNNRPVERHEINDFVIFVLGTIWDSRGLDTLFSATKGLQNCRIIMAGNIPQNHVKTAILENPIVDYRGMLSQEETFKLYPQSDCVFTFYDPILLINRIASPTKLYEAMMMGKPVIMNDEVLISKQVSEWDIGFTCRYNDIDGLRNLIEKMIVDRTELLNKGRNAYHLHETKFNWENYEPKFWQILGGVVKS